MDHVINDNEDKGDENAKNPLVLGLAPNNRTEVR
jgi:hypothetical protein